MAKKKTNIISTILIMFITLFTNAQEQLSITEILKKSSQACLDIELIEYEVTHSNEKGKYGFPKINARFIQQRSPGITDVGFDEALIKVTGTYEKNSKVSEFSFSYDGNDFMFQKSKKHDEKRIKNPSRKTTMGLLQQHLFMLRFFPFTEKTPFKPRWGSYTFEGKEEIKNELCFKIKSEAKMTMPNGQIKKVRDIWWISTQSFLPVAFSDGFVKKEISILKLGKKRPRDFYTLSKENKKTTTITNQDAQEEMTAHLLKKGTTVPKWSSTSQKDLLFSSEELKGKVVFIDFWGTWCPPCVKAMPDIERLYQHFKGNKDVVIIGISVNERKPNDAETYFRNNGFNYIHIPNGDQIAASFKVKEYPTVYIINKKGKIVSLGIGYNSVYDFDKWKSVIDIYLR